MSVDEYLELVFDIPLDRRFTYRNLTEAPAGLGYRVEAVFGRRLAIGCVVGLGDCAPADCPPEKIKTIRRLIDPVALFSPELITLSAWMARTYFSSQGECLFSMLPGAKRESEFPGSGLEATELSSRPPRLSEEQGRALTDILAQEGEYHYLYGITGSGKTEVFLEAAEACLAKCRDVIYLVPEIALSAQVAESVSARFGSQVALLHSGLTPSQRLGEWRRIASGQARVVVGARSAVFAPVKNLGLIVIDEEHEASYKSGSSPRYHARQVAMRRCRDAGATLLMGSATPSVEAWALMDQGKIRRHQLKRRVAGGAIPDITVMPMAGLSTAISPLLAEEIRTTKAMGRQTILFLNRRGFSHYFQCRSCGYELKCRNCSVSLTYHKDRHKMICHYCGYQVDEPSSCPSCHSLDVGSGGFGTEAIEEEAARLFPDLCIQRLDTDVAQKRGRAESIINDFRQGRIDLLLGTQMVAKGLNFPSLRLVGVVMADTALHLPDFRAAERAFSLIIQVAGRAGRYFPDGKVIIQSHLPQAPAISLSALGDIEGFYRQELHERSLADFPPFSRLLRFVFRSKSLDACRQCAQAFASRCRQALAPSSNEVLGPAECPISRIAGNHRLHIIVRTHDYPACHQALDLAFRAFQGLPQVYIEVDPDPVSLL